MDRAHDEFEAAGIRLVLIGQATPRQAAHFRKLQEIELTVLADEPRLSYKAAGTKLGGVGDLLGPKVFAKGLATMARSGKMQGRTDGNPAQL
ncbi:MAG: AhpC/TSA antioxidant enzyme [Solirubrobacteraceae bacterium]|nr:AhpC/TSA antioxidant enzyme [Solirubrobacteraceae bacterium]